MKFDEWANSSLSQQTITTHPVYLALMIFVFPRLCIDAVQFCSKSASCHFAEKLSSGSHTVPLTKDRTVGVIPTSRLGGCTSLLLLPGAENPSYATGIGIARDSITACSRCCSRVSELPWVGNYGSGRPGSKHFRPSSSCEWSTHAAVLSLRWVLVRVAIPLRGREVFVLVTEFQGMAVNGLYCADVLRPLDLVPLTDFTYKYHPTEGIGVGAGGGTGG